MTMKQVVLRFGQGGNLAVGFALHLRIYTASETLTEIDGALPPDPVLLHIYESLRDSYRQQCHLAYRGFRGLEALDEVTHISIRDAAVDFTQGLNDWLDHSPEFQPIREELLDHLNRTDRVRFVIHTQNPVLQWLPWHLCNLFQRYPYGGVSLSLPRRSHSLPYASSQSRVRVLAVLGDSTGINIQADLWLLQDKLPPDAEILPPLVAISRKVLGEKLWEQSPNILFFAGHSSSTGPQGEFFLNEFESVTIADLKFALSKAIEKGLKLAIFNSCDGLKLAQDLADLNLPAIIVMRERIPDAAAQYFLDYFLTAFADPTDPKPLTLAVREAQERLHHLEQDYPCASWLPVLCQQPEAADLTWADLHAPPKPSPIKAEIKRFPVRIVSVMLGALVLSFSMIKPNLAAYFNKQASNCINQSDLICAKQNLDIALRLNNRNGSVHNNLSRFYEKIKDYPKRDHHLDIAVALGDAAACTGKAVRLIHADQLSEAESLLHGCQQIKNLSNTVKYSIYKNYGWIYYEQEHFQKARIALEKSLVYRPQMGAAHCLLGRVKLKENPENLKSEIGEHFQVCVAHTYKDRIEELEWSKFAEDYLDQLQE
ncbi:CHAT domain-containing protein [Spirulina sp. CCNP1310]|uniref:CHAT domain-containing tetratricopeptide repeat protein n=1 Tax=Spirulina sp. CCNP1310 TaxID=3110249 RepID=UPI002B1F8307|nr:CHAT domain-containing protein [Spirulina sp. CCNP1310]MEA5418205.1 CHAT domain-containing protein [Spirulina sp. CCNP1310]